MNKAQLVEALESRMGSKKAAAEALDAVVDTITRAVVRGEKVAISGFGSFEKAVRNARTGRNPRTGEKVRIKKTSVPRFKAGTSFKSYVADPRSLPKAAAGSASTSRTATKSTTTRTATRTASKTTATRSPAKKSAAKTLAKKTSSAPARKAAAKTLAKKTPARKTAAKATTAKTTARKTATKATAKKTATKRTTGRG